MLSDVPQKNNALFFKKKEKSSILFDFGNINVSFRDLNEEEFKRHDIIFKNLFL